MVCSQDRLESLDGIALVLDSRLTVVAGGWGNWARFWHDNGGAAPAPAVLGRDLTAAFSCGALRSGFRAALMAVALGERPALRMGFRCDGPGVRRDMRLTVARCGAGRLLYHSVTLAETALPRALDVAPVSCCAVCGALDPADPGALDWVEGPSGRPPLPASDTLCPRCALGLAAHAA
ncbi:hypothetical protein [Rhodobaculum claviforme]|uniref:Uncharacterized protein n=1 Tax=Rhodobaculum claviforme TaxID=1549854 RepID=A0A934TN10_9RHOB|nr:hypothetical protein [Rhodobaculum claviforme]MBK5928673.1 hypothetical protein [Rhodobaculum claviforme]